MTTPLEIDRELLERLVRKRQYDVDFETKSESAIRSEYIDPLFKALGWDPENIDPDGPDEWRREISGLEGRADYFVNVHDRPVLAIEAKRAGHIRGTADRTRLDRTPEEKQALRYTREHRVPWAVLTNFDRLLIFDADGERLLLGFNSPAEYLPSLDADPASSLRQLSCAAVSGGSLDWLRDLALKGEVDEEFLDLLQELRVMLARDLLAEHRQNPELHTAEGALDLDALLAVVQRVLDRLILVRFADDQEILRQHDLLANLLKQFEALGEYHSKDELHSMLGRLWAAVDRIHDTTIFQQGHLCERLPLSNTVLTNVIAALNGVSFRKFTSDILGATYESYLGTTLEFDRTGQLVQRTEPEKRRWAGIYYTPHYIVDAIVRRTLGRKLNDLIQRFGLRAIEQVRGLRVLDPACGSGSFLIQAYELLADFYRTLNGEIESEFNRLTEGITDPFEQVERARDLPRKVIDYPLVILTEHLYGVDIDGEAAEIATLNLVMRAFRELRSLGRRDDKLPLILNQNVKVGNSLFDRYGVSREDYVRVRGATLKELWERRTRLAHSRADQERRAILEEIAAMSRVERADEEKLGLIAAEPGSKQFDWLAEFPEVWIDSNGALRPDAGFDVVIGNPPYIRIQRLSEAWPNEAEYYGTRYRAAQVGNYDIYVLFVERGLSLLAPAGEMGFIIPNKFLKAKYGAGLRQTLAEGRNVREIVNFGHEQVFKGATTYTCLLFLSGQPNESVDAESVQDLPRWVAGDNQGPDSIPATRLTEGEWSLEAGHERELLERLAAESTLLKDVAERIFQGIIPGADKVYTVELLEESSGRALCRSRALGRDVDLDPALLRKIVSGTDVVPFGFLDSSTLVIYPYQTTGGRTELIDPTRLQTQYPLTSQYFSETRELLDLRDHGAAKGDQWYRYIRTQNIGLQALTKLAIPRLVNRLKAAYDEGGEYCLDNVDVGGVILRPGLPTSYEYVLGLLNSRLLDFYFVRNSVPFRGRFYSANRQYIENLPVAPAKVTKEDAATQAEIGQIAIRIRDLQRGRAAGQPQTEFATQYADLQRELDLRVYELFRLSPEDQSIVDASYEQADQEAM